jgi:transposase
MTQPYLDQIDLLTAKTEDLTLGLRDAASVRGARVGPVTAGTVMAFAPDLRTFASGRNFAAWLGLGRGSDPRVINSTMAG